MIILPIVVIIALEVVYYISTSSHGITLVDDKSPFIHYIWVYIPALIMFTIRCLFTSVEFGTRIVQPYSLLREGSAAPETTILENQLRKIALYGLFDTLRKRQLALAAATSSLFLAAINPIVVSGLYTAKASWPKSPMNITQTTRWNLGDPTQSGDFWKYIKSVDFNTDKITGLIIHLNLSDSQWTYNNLAFPQFILTDTINPPDTGYIDTRIPVLCSQLICTEGQIGCKNSDTEVPYIQCGFDDPCYSATPWGTYVSSDEKPKLGHLSSDVFVDALTKGIHGVPAEELMDPITLSARINTVWGIIMAQMFNFNGRESFHDPLNTTWFVHPITSHAPVYEGVFHDGRKYFMQSEISTRILDGLLGGMVVCALVALCTMRTKGVLPKSPCSIASVASFVVGSKFLGALRGAEWCNDAELRERGLFERLFSMGWWKVEREVTSIQSIQLASSASSLSGTRDKDTQEEGNGFSAGDGEVASSQSIHSGLNASSLSGVENEEAQEGSKTTMESGDAPIRFEIDIAGHRPLLGDVE